MRIDFISSDREQQPIHTSCFNKRQTKEDELGYPVGILLAHSPVAAGLKASMRLGCVVSTLGATLISGIVTQLLSVGALSLDEWLVAL
jgi:hypothetical protein